MSRVHGRRVYSSAATATKLAIAASHVKNFPPKEAIVPIAQPRSKSARSSKSPRIPNTNAAFPGSFFNAAEWASLQPPPSTAVSAFAHRTGLADILPADTLETTLRTACTHSSFLSLHSRYYPTSPAPVHNANLSTLGNTLLGLFASEYIHASYPHLPLRVLKASVSAYVGPLTCASIAQEMGAVSLLRWYRRSNTPNAPALLHSDALASIPRALVALIFTHGSIDAARKFAHSFFLSREVDLRAMIKFRNPKRALLETVDKFGRERPKSRLLKETGRFSQSPVFVVGIYSGQDKLGEGFGSSLKMAEYRAAEDSLHRLYLTCTPPHLLSLPSSTLPTSFPRSLASLASNISAASSQPPASSELTPDPNAPVFAEEDAFEAAYVPGPLGEPEVLYASGGKSGVVMPKRKPDAGWDGDVLEDEVSSRRSAEDDES
ncbi:ribonuclease III [Coniophora puteana RWD-64-598 SS2]|uniref:Large ribosomal subunit protein mL44 n=1 Tax=Coniophora puteana (strain RWD-64-598) TaxID=741705 RepID=A0A5M3MJL8_CONPW|nr:ribonuclease III [Coniophora puteana RWD-64-598 SS2]EIW79246.1 ribonuclease III [Coniophora puteana RWD-64-598 SS2]